MTHQLSALSGVSDVTIGLVPEGRSTVVVSCDQPLAEDAVRSAVDEAGYLLVGAAAA